MRLGEIKGSLKIDMVETTRGCPEDCLQCGFFDGFNREQRIVRSLDPDTIQRLLLQQDTESGVRLSNLLNTFVTTQVGTEPLRATNFADFVTLAHTLSEGKSRVVALTHGVWADYKEMEQRLENIAGLMQRKIVPLIVVTVDQARRKGRVSHQRNMESYVRTFQILRPALGYGRVPASIQGKADPASPPYIENAKRLFNEVIERLQWPADELNRLVIYIRDSYVDTGRAHLIALSSRRRAPEPFFCDVIPDKQFVAENLPQTHQWRGMIRFDGLLVVQEN